MFGASFTNLPEPVPGGLWGARHDAGWVEPTPWRWWQPVGFFGGFDFFPFTRVVVFNHRDFFRHHDHFFHDHNDRFFHRDRNGRFFNGSEFGTQHNDASRGNFFGMSATTNPSVAGSRRESFHKASVLTAKSTSTGGSVGLTAPRMSRRFAIRQGNTIVQRNFTWPFNGCSLHLESSKSDDESIRTTIFTDTADRFDGAKFRYGSQLCQVWHDRGSPQKWLRWWA